MHHQSQLPAIHLVLTWSIDTLGIILKLLMDAALDKSAQIFSGKCLAAIRRESQHISDEIFLFIIIARLLANITPRKRNIVLYRAMGGQIHEIEPPPPIAVALATFPAAEVGEEGIRILDEPPEPDEEVDRFLQVRFCWGLEFDVGWFGED